MASTAIGNTLHFQFVQQSNAFPADEIAIWGAHTEVVDDNTDLLNTLQTWWTSGMAPFFKVGVSLERIIISAWGGTRYVGAAQRIFPVPVPGGAGSPLPPQVAGVVSLRSNEIPGGLGDTSKWNRSYTGYVAPGVLDSTGRMTVTNANTLRDSFVALDTALRAVPRAAPATDGGLLVVSAQAALGADPDFVQVDTVLDTQRRRRNNVPAVKSVTLL